MSKLYAIVAGVGPGTGAAIAKKFAKSYQVVLLGRTMANLKSVEQGITESGGKAICVEADVSSHDSMKNALRTAEAELGSDYHCAAAIFNASARPVWKSFLETSDDEFQSMLRGTCHGAFNFAQTMLPKLLEAVDKSSTYPPTLIFTGATAAIKGSAMLAPFAMGKTATRTMAQSLAREFGPKGVHVSHAIIDGMIDIPSSASMLADKGPNEKISPETIAETYWYLHTQPVSGFSHELEIRPSAEKW